MTKYFVIVPIVILLLLTILNTQTPNWLRLFAIVGTVWISIWIYKKGGK